MYDIFIIGGGASGMTAAVTAAREAPNASIGIIEKNNCLGKKVLASGNGRCNITNISCAQCDAVRAFLSSIGIITREEEQGRVYPYCGQASHVVNTFNTKLLALGISLHLGKTVDRVEPLDDGGFAVCCGDDVYYTKKLLIAAGGKAAPAFGTCGDGYAFAKAFGHHIVRLFPVLTTLQSANREEASSLRGIRAKGTVTLFRDSVEIAKEYGEVQFTETGISGISVFNLSRFVRLADGEKPAEGFGRFFVAIDFMPEYDQESIERILSEKKNIRGMKMETLLDTIVDRKIAAVICKRIQTLTVSQPSCMDSELISKMAEMLVHFRIDIAGAGGWKEAQCTSGGVALKEIAHDTMESKRINGLYFAGEIIDYDGPCGGFNLQHAWETGIKAGKAMAKGLK